MAQVDRRNGSFLENQDAQARVDRHLVAIRSTAPGHFNLVGLIGRENAGSFAEWLRSEVRGNRAAHPDTHDTHIDLGSVEFRDVTGIHALVNVARDLDGEGRLILHGLPHKLGTTMKAVGWGDMRSLVIADRRSIDD